MRQNDDTFIRITALDQAIKTITSANVYASADNIVKIAKIYEAYIKDESQGESEEPGDS